MGLVLGSGEGVGGEVGRWCRRASMCGGGRDAMRWETGRSGACCRHSSTQSNPIGSSHALPPLLADRHPVSAASSTQEPGTSVELKSSMCSLPISPQEDLYNDNYEEGEEIKSGQTSAEASVRILRICKYYGATPFNRLRLPLRALDFLGETEFCPEISLARRVLLSDESSPACDSDSKHDDHISFVLTIGTHLCEKFNVLERQPRSFHECPR